MQLKGSVYRRFLTIILPICVSVFVALIAVFEWTNYQQSRQILMDKLETLSSAYSLLLAAPVYNKNMANLSLYGVSLISDQDIVGIRVEDAEGDVLEAFGVLDIQDSELLQRREIKYPTDKGTETVGYLTMGVSADRIIVEMESRIRYETMLLLALVIAVLLGVLIAYRVAVGNPLRRLVMAIQRYEADGTHVPVTSDSEDELGAVINAYNQMQQQQASSQLKLMGYQQSLETRVSERTRALENELASHAETTQALRNEASHDALTGLFNRREFERRLADICNNIDASDSQHALCFIDLDRFKIVNDTSGHIAGDAFLKRIAKELSNYMRKGDVLARVGGDEFGVLLMNCDLKDSSAVMQTMADSIDDFRFVWQEHVFKVSLSIGLVAITSDSGNANVLMSKVDAACYLAKKGGRNQVRIHTDEDQDLVAHQGEIRWLAEVRHALEKERFELWYHPIVKVASDKKMKDPRSICEMLLRLRLDDGSLHTPVEFLLAAERHGLSMNVDLWVINHVLRWLASGEAASIGITRCFINLSGASLGEAVFLKRVLEIFEKSGVPGEHIGFEITETAMISNMKAARIFMGEFSKRGCVFSLDDFGSGLSSFEYLRSLPVEFVKIEGSFVRDMVEDRIDYEMVKAINAMAHAMDQKVIAEYVESPEIMTKLREIGVDYVQGNWLGQPMPVLSGGDKQREHQSVLN